MPKKKMDYFGEIQYVEIDLINAKLPLAIWRIIMRIGGWIWPSNFLHHLIYIL